MLNNMTHEESQRPRLSISFSGGRSSAVMTKICLERYSETHDMLITFANTGCEHEDTLRFVDAVDRNWCNGKVVWIEAEIGPVGVGPKAKVVDYESASRNGQPFEDAIRKHGVSNAAFPSCTWRVKVEPMQDYIINQNGWEKGSYDTAIGIRVDEVDRVSVNRKKNRIVYPLITDGWSRSRVNDYMSRFEWDLNLPSDAYGNCVWCWKKSHRKLLTIAKDHPEFFDFPNKMENLNSPAHLPDRKESCRTFFRKGRSASSIVKEAQEVEFTPFTDSRQMSMFAVWDDDLDMSNGSCGESCEIDFSEEGDTE